MHAVRVGRSLEVPDTALPQLMHHHGFIIWQSRGFTGLLGHHKMATIGRSVLRFVAPEYAPHVLDVIRKPPVRSRLRVELVRADGERVPVNVVGKTVVVQGLKVRLVDLKKYINTF